MTRCGEGNIIYMMRRCNLKKDVYTFVFLQQKSLSVSATLYHLESAFSSIACARPLDPRKGASGERSPVIARISGRCCESVEGILKVWDETNLILSAEIQRPEAWFKRYRYVLFFHAEPCTNPIPENYVCWMRKPLKTEDFEWTHQHLQLRSYLYGAKLGWNWMLNPNQVQNQQSLG